MAAEDEMAALLRPTTPLVTAPHPLGEAHRLIVWSGESVRRWPVPPEGQLVIGRAPEVDVQVASPTVSRQHARLEMTRGAAYLTDLASQNGTRVNGERISTTRPLAYGDILSFGEITAAFVEDKDAPSEVGAEEDPDGEGEREGDGAGGAKGGTAATVPQRGHIVSLGDRRALVADPAMRSLYAQLELLAPSDLTVLILGETGTGKELAATALRHWSKRRAQPMVTINCASLPESLAESELFGHERGAFSGAVQAKPGLLESARGGTVFLDEIGDLSLPVQAKLLRVLETHRLTRLGSVQEREVDIRVVAATHRNLVDDVRTGRFREDLYYRLSAAVVRLPALRSRVKEIPVLARAFLEQACRLLGRAPLALGDAAAARLCAHDWPGNVRELKNLADYLAATVTDSVVLPQHLLQRLGPEISTRLEPVAATFGPFRHQGGAASSRSETVEFRPLAEANREFERQRIETALAATNGNKTQAARLLGVPLRTFMEKIKRHGLA